MFVDYGESGVELWNVETGKPVHYYRQIQGASGSTRLSGNDQVAIVWGMQLMGTTAAWAFGIWRKINASMNFLPRLLVVMAGDAGF